MTTLNNVEVRSMTGAYQAMAAASRQVVTNANPDYPVSRSCIAGLATVREAHWNVIQPVQESKL
jgi:hypothetical protein